MNKILYILPALAVLGMFSAVDAATDQQLQERIDRLQAKIDRLQERIDAADPDRDAKRIDKWEKKIAKHEKRIVELQAKMEVQPAGTARFIEPPEEQEPRALRQASDITPPTASSATLDVAGRTMEITFSEAIDHDVNLDLIYIVGATGSNRISDSTITSTTGDVLTLTLLQSHVDGIGTSPILTIVRNAVYDQGDPANGIEAVDLPITVTNPPAENTPAENTPAENTPADETSDDIPMIATVTLTEDGRWENSPGTVDLAKSGLMAFSVDFVNNDDRTHTVYADLISYDFRHAWVDIQIHPGVTLNASTWIIDNHMQPGDIAYLVYGVADDPGTPEREPDTIRGDQAVKIRIIDPVS